MNTFIKQLFIHTLYMVIVFTGLMFCISSTTFFTSRIETLAGLSGWEQGATFERTGDLNEWLENDINESRLLLIGASSSFRNINPFIVDSLLGVNSFNAGSPGMSVGVAYYLVESISKEIELDLVVLDINPLVWGSYRTRTIDDWILNSKDPFKNYIVHLTLNRGYFKQYILLYYRFIKYLNPLSKRKALSFDKSRKYIGKGMECLDKTDFNYLYQDRSIEWSDDNLLHLTKFNELSKKRNFELNLLITPVIDIKIDLSEIKQYKNIIHNMNNYQSKYKKEWFNDEVHLNCIGASKYSIILSNIINSK